MYGKVDIISVSTLSHSIYVRLIPNNFNTYTQKRKDNIPEGPEGHYCKKDFFFTSLILKLGQDTILLLLLA
jgi:hypothetical protein